MEDQSFRKIHLNLRDPPKMITVNATDEQKDRINAPYTGSDDRVDYLLSLNLTAVKSMADAQKNDSGLRKNNLE